MRLTLIAAVSENNVIGINGKIPWHIKEDMARFKKLTLGKPVIMGRNTFDSIIQTLGKPLPNRTNIVITSRDLNNDLPRINNTEIIKCKSFESAVSVASKFSEEGFVIGGERVYIEALASPYLNALEITQVKGNYEGDTFFPKIDYSIWRETNREPNERFDFVTYRR